MNTLKTKIENYKLPLIVIPLVVLFISMAVIHIVHLTQLGLINWNN